MFGKNEQRGRSSIVSVRLEPGRHRSPSDGVCVVELASMIGDEKFTDRPNCVCPVIGSFLRCWNDRAGYADRQRLYPYASRVVGTGGHRRISRIRRDLCLSYSGANLRRGPLRRAAARLRMRGRIAWAVGIFPSIWLREGAGAYAAYIAFARGGREEALALLDRLLEVGSSPPVPSSNGTEARNGNGNGNERREADLAVRAAIIARERARSRAARGSGSAPAAAEDRPPDRRAGRPRADSSV
jgi:hypothetical protein